MLFRSDPNSLTDHGSQIFSNVFCTFLANALVNKINFDLFQEMANKKATVGAMITALKEAGMSSIAEDVFKVTV